MKNIFSDIKIHSEKQMELWLRVCEDSTRILQDQHLTLHEIENIQEKDPLNLPHESLAITRQFHGSVRSVLGGAALELELGLSINDREGFFYIHEASRFSQPPHDGIITAMELIQQAVVYAQFELPEEYNLYIPKNV